VATPRDAATETLRETLRGFRLFRDLDDPGLDRLLALGRVNRVRRKTVLYTEGQEHEGVWIVLQGLVVVYKLSPDGRMLILRVCRPGSSFGETGLFEEAGATHSAHARTTRDGSLLFLPRDRFAPFLKDHPEVSWRLLGEFGERLREMAATLEGVAFREVTSRLARYLVRELEASGGPEGPHPSVDLPLAKGSLASYLGAAHETLSRSLQRLSRQGIVRVDGARVTVLDLDRLRQLV
jgi:CRP/FNR family transcriptional regulator